MLSKTVMASTGDLGRSAECDDTPVNGPSTAPVHTLLEDLVNRLREINGGIRQLELCLQSEAEKYDLRETLKQKNKALASLADEVAALEQKNLALSERNVTLGKENADLEKKNDVSEGKLQELESILDTTSKEGTRANAAERTDA